MQFTTDNRQDIAKYYQHTYLKFKETGDLLFYIAGVDGYKVTGQIEDKRDFVIWLNNEHPYEVDYLLPHKSFFQYGDKAVMLCRVPARQYYRGISAENTSLQYMSPSGVKSVDLGFETLKAFVSKQKFFTLSEARKASAQSCAMSPRMMYRKDIYSICIDFTTIAQVTNKGEIKMVLPLFKQEVVDFLIQTQEQHLYTIKE